MSYPSVISQPGSAQRNLEPITAALEPLVSQTLGESSKEARTSSSNRVKVLELASYPYTHITSFARKWPELEWRGTCRDQSEADEVEKQWDKINRSELHNLERPRNLDISSEHQWAELSNAVEKDGVPFNGVVILNLIHCVPSEYPEQIFRHLSPNLGEGRALLDNQRGWIAVYGPFKNDDGTYKSVADEAFDTSYIRAKHPSLGLRTISSISDMAERWGFIEESRETLAKGNMFIVWRVMST